MQWIDWQPTFQNYSKLVPGIASVPLAYVTWRQPTPDPNFVGDVLGNNIANAPLVGPNFCKDSKDVYTLLLTFITEYPEVEAIVCMASMTNGLIAFKALVEHFEGVGALSIDLVQAVQTLKKYTMPVKGHLICIGSNLRKSLN